MESPKTLGTVINQAKQASYERFIVWITDPARVAQSAYLLSFLSFIYVVFYLDVHVAIRQEARDVRQYVRPKLISIALGIIVLLIMLFNFVRLSVLS